MTLVALGHSTATIFCCVAGVDGTLTVQPRNTAVVSGSSATLQCSSNLGSSSIVWQHPPGIFVVINCVVQSGSTSQFSVDNSSTGQCDLIVRSAGASLAGSYQCVDGNFDSFNAYLTVLGKLTGRCTFLKQQTLATISEKRRRSAIITSDFCQLCLLFHLFYSQALVRYFCIDHDNVPVSLFCCNHVWQ